MKLSVKRSGYLVNYLKQVKLADTSLPTLVPSLGKILPALIAALAWVSLTCVSTWRKPATEVLRMKSALRSIEQSVGHLLPSSTIAAAHMPPRDRKADIAAPRQTRAFLKNISERFTDGSWAREFDSRWSRVQDGDSCFLFVLLFGNICPCTVYIYIYPKLKQTARSHLSLFNALRNGCGLRSADQRLLKYKKIWLSILIAVACSSIRSGPHIDFSRTRIVTSVLIATRLCAIQSWLHGLE